MSGDTLAPHRTMTPPGQIDGAHAVYHYLQKELLEDDVWLFQMVATRLALGLGIWFDAEHYRRGPILKPYARRDPTARGNPRTGQPDRWGSPDAEGVLRDDNSLIKRLPFPLPISGGANRLYAGKRASRGFVCAHIWRHKRDGTPAARDWRTYSFVPNLIWLPAQVAKLTDRPGSFLQGYLQALSWKLFRDLPVNEALRPLMDETWELLAEPTGVPPQGLPDFNSLNCFQEPVAFARRRTAELESILVALDHAIVGTPIAISRTVPRRYRERLPEVSNRALRRRRRILRAYRGGLEQSADGADARTE